MAGSAVRGPDSQKDQNPERTTARAHGRALAGRPAYPKQGTDTHVGGFSSDSREARARGGATTHRCHASPFWNFTAGWARRPRVTSRETSPRMFMF